MKYFLVVGLATLVSCASVNRAHQTELRTLLAKKDNVGALKFVSKDDFLKEKNSLLLRSLERGRVRFLNAHYFEALKDFERAKDLSDELFTVSMSKKAASVLVNDNADNYYGETYERSLIRYYQSLTHLMLSKVGVYEAYQALEYDNDGKIVKTTNIPEKKLSEQESRFHLTAAKSVLLEWDSYLNSIKAVTGGRPTFKDDLLAKVYGGFLHEQLGSKSDLQVAKDLYRVGKDVLFRNYNIYPVYNEKFAEFRKNFSSFGTANLKDVETNFVSKSKWSVGVDDFLTNKIKLLERKNSSSCLLAVEEGFVTEKKAKILDFSIGQAAAGGSVASNLSDPGFIQFAMKAVEVAVDVAADQMPKIYFEIPEIPLEPTTYATAKLVLKNKKTGNQTELDLNLIEPISELASQVIDEKLISTYAKTGARVAGKHLVALVSAYEIFKSGRGKLGDTFAMLAATSAYKLANKGIKESEAADLRSWQSIPKNIWFSNVELADGEYSVSVDLGGSVKNVGDISVHESSKVCLHNLQF